MTIKNYLIIIIVCLATAGIHSQTPINTYLKASDTTIKYPAGIKKSADNDLLVQALKEKNKELETIKIQSQAAHLDDLMHHKERDVFITGIALLLALVLVIYFLYNKRVQHHDKTLSSISQYQSHELRSPLVKIMGLVEVIKKSEEITHPETIRQLEMLEKASEELDQAIHKIVKRAEASRDED
ncbi:MAG: hypothetical protein ACKOXF_10995 [Chitinophagaceae bacterium]